jgi:hypothetical protein
MGAKRVKQSSIERFLSVAHITPNAIGRLFLGGGLRRRVVFLGSCLLPGRLQELVIGQVNDGGNRLSELLNNVIDVGVIGGFGG